MDAIGRSCGLRGDEALPTCGPVGRRSHESRARPASRKDGKTSGPNINERRSPPLMNLVADAIDADRRLKVTLSALAKALQTAQVDGDSLRLASDLDQWLRACDRLSPIAAKSLAAAVTQPLAGALTRKERQVLELLACGFSNDRMATQLFVSESTVRTHLRSINQKLRAGSRMQAVAIARSIGLVA